MRNIVITGASSGLGLAFVKHYRSEFPNAVIYALDRVDFPLEVLSSFTLREETETQFRFTKIDVTDTDAIVELGKSFDRQELCIDLVIHCAGVRGLVSSVPLRTFADVANSETLDVMDIATLSRTFEINCLGTFVFLRALLPSMRRAARDKDHKPPRAVILGSRMGSIGHIDVTHQGGGYAYRASKAALNMVIKTMSVDVPDVVWVILHPGRVETRIVSLKEDGAIPVDVATTDCVNLIRRLDSSQTGSFIDRFGDKIEW